MFIKWLVLAFSCITCQASEEFLYTFNEKGQVIAAHATDLSAAYVYDYDDEGDLTEVNDLLFGANFTRIYDKAGRLQQETFCDRFQIKYDYDVSGKRSCLTLPDGSSIVYGYEKEFLSTITRFSSKGTPLYTHTFEEYDESGRLSKEKLIGNAGFIRHSYDGLGRHIAMVTPLREESVQSYETNGSPSIILQGSHFLDYTYAANGALLEEPGHTYTYDERSNRTSKDGVPYSVDEKNRLLSTYAYDEVGNAISKGPLKLSYDAFGRLWRVEFPHTFQNIYRYDGMHRRLIEERYSWDGQKWQLVEIFYFIYDNQYEIGTVNAKGQWIECRILGRRENGDVGSAISIEVPQGIFAPVHDLFGNVAALISPEDGRCIQLYSYSAFGEEESTGHRLSPWRYNSKRSDPFTGFIFFGRRYYDPQAGRWLTPDPAKQIDGPNLYTFVHNNPLLFSDLFGLESVLSQISFWLGTTIQWYCYHVIPFPGVRNIGIRIGEWMGAVPIPDQDSCSHVGAVGEYDPTRPHVNIWINGINYDLNFTIEIAELLSQASGGDKVYYVYNGTNGFMADIWEFLAGKLYLRTPAPTIVYQAIQEAITEVGPEGKVTIFAHSYGAAVLERAIKRLSDKEKQMLEIYTFGSAAIFYPNRFEKVNHILSNRDYFAFCADPLRYLYAYFWNPATMNIKESKSGSCLENHAILGPVYQKEILNICAQLQAEKNKINNSNNETSCMKN